jgi:hypothetical protein
MTLVLAPDATNVTNHPGTTCGPACDARTQDATATSTGLCNTGALALTGTPLTTIACPSALSTAMASAFTVGVWVRLPPAGPSPSAEEQLLAWRAGDPESGEGWIVSSTPLIANGADGATLCFTLYMPSASLKWCELVTALHDGAWHLVMVASTANHGLAVYKDGLSAIAGFQGELSSSPVTSCALSFGPARVDDEDSTVTEIENAFLLGVGLTPQDIFALWESRSGP